MNIFVLSQNPRIAAELQCDKHVVKMIVESAQMLSTAHRILDGQLTVDRSGKRIKKLYTHPDPDMDSILYKVAHANHPCTLWTIESMTNYQWHYEHFVALCNEYTYRYGKIHMTDTKLRVVLSQYPTNITDKGLTPFALAMKAQPECVVEGDPVKSYQNFYRTKQDRFKMVWSKREVPEFINKE
jgi:hypothetical protein